MVGTELLHYKILRKLGQGGMGEVWLAEDGKLGRKVALKVLPADVADDPARRARFEREARAIAALNHPNIVTVHSVEEAGGTFFITMELVEGKPLSELIPRGGLPLGRFLEYAVPIADALAAAHKQGVTHRDLKPDNVMVGDDGRVKVLDFGLAKLRDEGGEGKAAGAATQAATMSVTQEGRVLGTVAYMSPEQAEGKTVDPRSDVFSFGVLLYEMATGRRPFQGETSISTITAILRDTPQSVTDLNTALPRHLSRIVRRCLAKDPERRYQSTADLRNELLEIKEEVETGEWEPPRAGVATGGGRRFNWWLVLVPLFATVLVVAWLASRSRSDHATVAPQGPFASVQMRRLTTAGEARSAAISPDARYIAYVLNDGGRQSLRVRQIATGDEVEIFAAHDEGIGGVAFSPDGNFVYYDAGQGGASAIYRVSTLGGTPRRVISQAFGPRVSPDGARIAYLTVDTQESTQTLTVAAVDGSDPRTLVQRSGQDHFDSPPKWSPDGRQIAAVTHSFAAGARSEITLFPVDGEDGQPLAIERLQGFDNFDWLPDGRGLLVVASEQSPFFGSTQIWYVDPASGSASPVTNDLNVYQGVSVSADGHAMVTVQTERRSGIDVGPADAGPDGFRVLLPESVAQHGGNGLDWTADGRIIHTTARDGRFQLRITEPSDGSGVFVTQDQANYVAPRLTPDGRSVLAAAIVSGPINVWRVELDGGRAEQLTTGGLEWDAQLSPDGNTLFYVTFVSSGFTVVRRALSGGDAQPVLDAGIFSFAISPDGSKLAYFQVDREAGRSVLRLRATEGGEVRTFADAPTESADQFTFLRWAPDGRSITWLQNREGDAILWSQPIAGGKPRELLRFDDREYTDHAWSRDGKQLALTRASQDGFAVLLSDTQRAEGGPGR